MTLDVDELMERTTLAKERTRLASERNRLANERTFLSWIRTGLAIVGGGVALMGLLSFENLLHRQIAQVAGLVLIVLGISMFILAALDYRKTSRELKVLPGFAGSPMTISVIVMILIATCMALILALTAFRFPK